jgi:hypothetical protein
VFNRETLPESVITAIEHLRTVADREQLARTSRLGLLSVLRSEVLGKRKPGRKRSEQVNRAYPDYKAGLRGLALYRKHVPNYHQLSRWRRREEGNKLLKNLQKRAQREKKCRQTETNPPEQSPPRQSTAQNGHPDISA